MLLSGRRSIIDDDIEGIKVREKTNRNIVIVIFMMKIY